MFRTLAILALASSLALPALAGEAIETIETDRKGVSEQMLRIDPPAASDTAMLLLVGGGGRADLAGHEPGWRGGNFLFRSADLFAAEGFLVGVLDSPDDMKALWNRRSGADHAGDILRAVEALKRKGAAKVWLVGTSMGTLSAVNAGLRLGSAQIAGIVLTSTVISSSKRSLESVMTMPLEDLALPVLLVAHRDDGCAVSPASGAPQVADRLKAAPVKRIMLFAGGDPPRSDACEAVAQHGYLGIEAQVVKAIAAWVRNPD